MAAASRLTATFGVAALILTLAAVATSEDETANGGPRYTPDGELLRPADYREWVNIGTGLNMAYGPLREQANGHPMFTSVFVNPSSYRAFLSSGAWQDQTVFILEVRGATAVNRSKTGNNGHFQGELMGLEAEVKDEKRFPGGWAFFNLSLDEPAGGKIPTSASCYSCHAKNAAVENTFVQFYPVLRDIAKEKGSLRKIAESF